MKMVSCSVQTRAHADGVIMHLGNELVAK